MSNQLSSIATSIALSPIFALRVFCHPDSLTRVYQSFDLPHHVGSDNSRSRHTVSLVETWRVDRLAVEDRNAGDNLKPPSSSRRVYPSREAWNEFDKRTRALAERARHL